MAISPSRWKSISPSNFPWEREALDFIREHLPDREPFRAWSNFEFISDDGSINEVDLLVLTPQGFFLVEIKSKPGIIRGDAMTWVWNHEGHNYTADNPIMLANRKAKRLASLLQKQSAARRIRVPYLEPLIFSSHPESQSQLQGVARNRLCLRDKPATADKPARRGIIAALLNRDFEGANENFRSLVDKPIAKAISNAMEQAGIRPSNRSRRVGDYILGDLLYESPTGTYQDWEGTHAAIERSKRRVRIYNIANSTSESARESIRRAARREFELLETVSHPGILHCEGFTEHELGPALIFRHDPEAVRLDHYLSQQADKLTVDTRLSLLRQVTEALNYAHEKRIVHRALSPQSILVSEPASTAPKTQIFNWQIAYRDKAASTKEGSKLTATSHPEQFVEDASTPYIAPEAISDTADLGEHVDVFSLGTIAYHIFSGQPPATTGLELVQKIRDGKGLQISAVVDGVGAELQELIQLSTHPEVSNRLDSASDFLELLNAVEEELTRPDRERDIVLDAINAGIGDRLEGGFEIKSRLGTGSSSVVFLVERDSRELVLKLANSVEHNERLLAEAEVLKKLRHPNIVEVYESVKIGELNAFLMQRAGEKTLAKRLREEGRLHIELLERFGEDLLEAVRYLEEVGVQHRDIKPDNIGIGPLTKNRRLRLLLFDFSLTQTPADNIRAGTTDYLDPFLSKNRRWDLAAERFAAAVTLYEMSTGLRPKWGDGQSNPAVLDCEVTLSGELFDPNLRDAMLDFFGKALRREASERFDNAEEMLRAWRSIFEGVDEAAPDESDDGVVDYSAMLQNATITSHVTTLGLSARAANAVDRINVLTVRDLLRLSVGKIRHLPGVGDKTRIEIAKLATELRKRFPDASAQIQYIATTETDSEGVEPEVASVDLIAAQIAKSKSRRDKDEDRRILQTFIGWAVEASASPFEWPSQSQVASKFRVTQTRVSQILTKARDRWSKNPSVTALRKTLAEILEANGGVMTVDELSTAVLIARGSGEEEPVRSQLASLITRAAVETERIVKEPRFLYQRAGQTIVVANNGDLADYVERLGREADVLADIDPIAPPSRVIERLRAVPSPEGTVSLSDARLIKLAVAAAIKAAVSSRMEIYPHGMPAGKALKLAHGALFGAGELTATELRKRVEGRYPDAEQLPDRPALDQLLDELGLDLKWQPAAASGIGAFCYPDSDTTGYTSSTHHVRFQTRLGAAPATGVVEVKPEIADARVFEGKLLRANDEGAFLALLTSPRQLIRAEEELLRRFDLNYHNLDEILIREMQAQAVAAGVDWKLVLQADAAPTESQDWRNLSILVGRAIPIVERQLSQSDKTILLTYPGLLARYDRLDLMERLRDKVGTPGGALHGLWVLLPSDEGIALPTLNGKPVPVISSGQWARVPDAWIYNEHRSDNGHIGSTDKGN